MVNNIPPNKIHLSSFTLFSINLIVVFDNPKVLAMSISLLCAPLSIILCSLRFSKELLPVDINSSRFLFALYRKRKESITNLCIFLRKLRKQIAQTCRELWCWIEWSISMVVSSSFLRLVNLLFRRSSRSLFSCSLL